METHITYFHIRLLIRQLSEKIIKLYLHFVRFQTRFINITLNVFEFTLFSLKERVTLFDFCFYVIFNISLDSTVLPRKERHAGITE